MAAYETRLERRIRRDFPEPGSAPEILRLLAELPSHPEDYLGSERVHAAIVLLANGNLSRFRQALDLSRTDWRDVLMAAGLADEDWPDHLDRELGPNEPPGPTLDS